jgi:hypothetical protein
MRAVPLLLILLSPSSAIEVVRDPVLDLMAMSTATQNLENELSHDAPEPALISVNEAEQSHTIEKDNYLMYVWNDRYDAARCGSNLPAKKDDETCWPHAWRSDAERSKLLAASVQPGRRVGRVLLSSVSSALSNAAGGECDADIRATLLSLHSRSVQVYALFGDSREEFVEAELIPRVVAWNQHCARSNQEKFDGVSVNNEALRHFKRDAERAAGWLGGLRRCRDAARAGQLPLHFSVGWHWGWRSVSNEEPNNVDFAGANKKVSEHIIDLVDSIDIQVGWTEAEQMVRRARLAGLSYARSQSKKVYILAYTNDVDEDCRLSFFPYSEGCSVGDHTESGMFAAFDATDGSWTGGIHYYGNAYSSGLPGWPTRFVTPTRSPTRRWHRLFNLHHRLYRPNRARKAIKRHRLSGGMPHHLKMMKALKTPSPK